MINHLQLHIASLRFALDALDSQLSLLQSWALRLSTAFESGQRLFIAGNGGSAAQAQHLAAELVGRYKLERDPFGAIALHTDSSNMTAIANDYGYEEVFARQLRGLARPGDIFLGLSTSGASPNVRAAARTARGLGLSTWTMTGDAPNPLAVESHEFLAVSSTDSAVIQEVHMVALHLLCEGIDDLATRKNVASSGARK